VSRAPRLAAGRARALGLPTRGTTAPNRLRRIDRWLLAAYGGLLRHAPDPLVIDLGYGSSPVTTVELAARLAALRPDVRVIGVENDRDRVAAASTAAPAAARSGRGPVPEFRYGGFDLAGLRPVLARAMNVLRQYDEPTAAAAWTELRARLAPGGLLVDGTCDETGRVACWIAIGRDGPRTLTLAARLATLDRPATLAERLPKALIHHNVPGARIHGFLATLDAGWVGAGGLPPRQRWLLAGRRAAAEGWPVSLRRAWQGEITVRWQAVAPPPCAEG
jgi:hypothetical protein